MIDPIVELKVLLKIIMNDKLSPQQKEATKKRIKELIIQLNLEDLQKDFE
jgi:hypothetical protein